MVKDKKLQIRIENETLEKMKLYDVNWSKMIRLFVHEQLDMLKIEVENEPKCLDFIDCRNYEPTSYHHKKCFHFKICGRTEFSEKDLLRK